MTTVLRRALPPLLVLAATAVAALLLAVVVVPLVRGWVPLTVLSGSMEPAVPAGSQVVVAPLEGEEGAAGLAAGDVVTFLARRGDPALVTRRIVGVTVDGEGRRSFTTRGDAEAAPDAEPVTDDRLHGVVKYHVPWAGYAATLLDPEQKRTGIVLLAAALFGYALWQFAGALRDRDPARAADAGAESAADPGAESAADPGAGETAGQRTGSGAGTGQDPGWDPAPAPVPDLVSESVPDLVSESVPDHVSESGQDPAPAPVPALGRDAVRVPAPTPAQGSVPVPVSAAAASTGARPLVTAASGR
ncbi:signal peptidase I [Kocuria sp. CPCC 205268]|uniref:signal peptidase I n=1 Tax=Kocuria oxytropis TaxID=3058913 RepID=UPI0034D43B33